VVLESTTYPGTTRERVVPILEESGLAAGRDFHVAFSPERVDPGRTDFTLRNTPKVMDDIRESPVLKILALLSALGADVRYRDPSRSRAQVDIAKSKVSRCANG
jgi:UDP-N-acetyl-D-mannosaminuronate dehydrogenase